MGIGASGVVKSVGRIFRVRGLGGCINVTGDWVAGGVSRTKCKGDGIR